MSSSRTEALASLPERVAPTPEEFRTEILPSGRPMVLSGVARDWPLINVLVSYWWDADENAA